VGVHEFADWCDTVDTEMMLAINLGSRGLDDARNFLEYVNGPTARIGATCARRTAAPTRSTSSSGASATRWMAPGRSATRRRRNMAGSANEVAKTMRAFDKKLELIVCGSSHANMPTYPDWEREVLEHTYDNVDHISAAHVFRQPRERAGPGRGRGGGRVGQEQRQLPGSQRETRRLYRHGGLDHRLREGQEAFEARRLYQL
jgi:alpha-N-arabinofuranosidase